MKRLLLFLMLCLPLVAFSQGIDPPGDITEIWAWFAAAMGTWGTAAAAILLITEKLKRTLKLKGGAAVILSWFLSIPISFIAAYFDLGIFAGVAWYVTLIYSISFSLSANLFYLTPAIKEITRFVIDWIDKRKLAKKNNK